MASLLPAAIRLTRMASDEASRAVAAATAGTAATADFGRLNTLSILEDPLISLRFLQFRSRQPSPPGHLELRLGFAERRHHRPGCASARASRAISGRAPAYSAARAGMDRTARAAASATPERSRPGRPPAYGSQTALARHTNLKVRSCRTSLRRLPASGSDAAEGRFMRADSAILRRLIHMTCWLIHMTCGFAPLILRLGARRQGDAPHHRGKRVG